MVKMIASWLLILSLGFSVSLNAESTLVSKPRYITGGVIGTIFGFGIGHAIQGRYSEIGWVFTVGEVAGLALGGASIGWFTKQALDAGKKVELKQLSGAPFALSIAGSILLTGFKIWEIVDVWANATPVDLEPKQALYLLNKDEKRFAGATELGVAAFNVDFINIPF